MLLKVPLLFKIIKVDNSYCCSCQKREEDKRYFEVVYYNFNNNLILFFLQFTETCPMHTVDQKSLLLAGRFLNNQKAAQCWEEEVPRQHIENSWKNTICDK